MRVVVNRMLCESNAICVAVAPEVFALEDDDLVLLDEQPPESVRQRVEEAVTLCPRIALSIVEE
jgi:ferredoxin